MSKDQVTQTTKGVSKRLREEAGWCDVGNPHEDHPKLMRRAADEIDRLRFAIQRGIADCRVGAYQSAHDFMKKAYDVEA